MEHFLRSKLSQRNYPSSLLRPEESDGRTEGEKRSLAASNGLLVNSRNGSGASPSTGAGIEAVNAALRDSAEEFEKLFAQAFSDLSSQLDITPETAYQSFKNVMDEVFKDGVNWGRVVGLFAFGGVLCVECVEKDARQLVYRIADWMTIYLDEHINPWIQSQGGWVSMPESDSATLNCRRLANKALFVLQCEICQHDYQNLFFFSRMSNSHELIYQVLVIFTT